LAALHCVADDGTEGLERPYQIGEFFFHNRFRSVDNREIQRDVEDTVVFLVLFPACDHVLEPIEVFLAQIVHFGGIFFQVKKLPLAGAEGLRHPQDFPVACEVSLQSEELVTDVVRSGVGRLRVPRE